MQTQVRLLRKDSLGIKGTILNAKCHANLVLPFIEAMQSSVMRLGFAEWVQGHNVHQFKTHDGRTFVLRPVWLKGVKYIGIRLSARLSRSSEFNLISITDVAEVPLMLTVMRAIAKPVLTDDRKDPKVV